MQGPFLREHCYHTAALHTVEHTFLKCRAPSSGSDVQEATNRSTSICKGPLPLASLILASVGFPATFLTAKYFGILYLIFQAPVSSLLDASLIFWCKN